MDLPEILKEQFGGETADIRTYSPLVLAYIGDGIYDLVIRTLIVRHGSCPAQQASQEDQRPGKGFRPVGDD